MSEEQPEGIPTPKDDDPEEVVDKLTIANAMWSRGERDDAIAWLRRAAESAADAELDMRSLELAKVAASLATAAPLATPAGGASIPNAQPPKASGSSVPKAPIAPPASRPADPPPPPSRPAAAGPPSQRMPSKGSSVPRPPATRPPTKSNVPPSKLAPLPPLRPLGTATPAGPPQSLVTKPSTNVPVGSPVRPPSVAPSPTNEPPKTTAETPNARADAPIPDFEQTTTLPIADAAKLIASSASELPEEMPKPRVEVHDVEQARRVMADEPVSVRMKPEDEPMPPSYDDQRVTNPIPPRPPSIEMPMPLAIGMRVRVFANEQGAWVVPEHEGGDSSGGVLAILIPVREEDDLRALFQAAHRM